MDIFGITIGRTRTLAERFKKGLSPVDSRGSWWPIIREFTSGAWQANVTVTAEDALQYWAVFRCVSIISGDIAKMRAKLVEFIDAERVWREVTVPAFSPVLRKPNRFQTRVQFFAHWMESKLTRGNTYVLKLRDNRNVVVGLYVLDPSRVQVLVSESGAVFYRLQQDTVNSVDGAVTVPASEIIHDRWNTLYHPLVGLSPIYAAGVQALTGLRMTQNSLRLFTNGARPSAVLEAPGAISDPTAARLKAYWDENFVGENAGKVAVLGDGLSYKPMMMTAVDAQLIEQLRWNDTTICGAFGVPAYMLNAGTAPAYNNVEALNQQYYSQCLQVHIEALEACLDEGLGLTEVEGHTYGVEFDLADLLRMDTAAKIKAATEGLRGIYKPNEARALFDLPPVDGGDEVYLQQQNFSLAALNKRDQQDDPFASGTSAPPASNDNGGDADAEDGEGEGAAATQAAAAYIVEFNRQAARLTATTRGQQ